MTEINQHFLRDFTIGSVLCIVVSLVLPALFNIHIDVIWSSFVAESLLAGKRIYVDIIEINPPMSILSLVPVVMAGKLISLSLATTVSLYVGVLAFISFAAVRWILATPQSTKPTAFALAYLISLFLLTNANFGQREQFVVILITPYLFIIARALNGETVQRWFHYLVIGAFSIGISFKPHFLLLPLVVYLFLYLRFKRRNLSLPPIYVVGLGAPFVVTLLQYAVFHEFVWLSIEFTSQFYIETKWGRRVLVHFFLTGLPFLLIACYFVINKELKLDVSPIVKILIISTGVMTIVYFTQYKGYGYQLLPFQVFATLAILYSLFEKFAPETDNFGSITKFQRISGAVLEL